MTDDKPRSRSIVELVRELPQLFMALLRAELDQFKRELARKAKHAGVGIGFFGAALAIALLLLPVLIAAGILALALVVPGWAAALIVAGAMIVVMAVLVFLGIRAFKKLSEPSTAVQSVREDADAVKGTGDYDL